MANEIDTIRKRIGDEPKTEIETYVGNGSLTGFDIHGTNPFGFEVTMTPPADPVITFEYDADIKKLLFASAPDNEVVINIKYKSAAFTDDELTAIYSGANNDLDQATAEALRQAMGSQARMVSFQHGDRSVSMSDIFKNLMSLLNSYEKRITNSGSNSGSSFAIGKRTIDEGPTQPNRPDDLSRLFL